MQTKSYDAIIVGAGHNGLVAACYLAQAGQRVLVLEKNAVPGGATRSQQLFPGVDVRVSVYSYLISLLPAKILADLGIRLDLRRRTIASYTPVEKNGAHTGLLISNVSEAVTRESFIAFTGSDREYQRYQELQRKIELFARKVWPTLLSPLLTKRDLREKFRTREERQVWDYLVEKPLSALIEEHLSDDIVRGAVFTDAKIGVSTYPEDPSLLQNRTFIYHTIGQGTGEWRVPVGGMGALVTALLVRARSLGIDLLTSTEVLRVEPGNPNHTVVYRLGERETAVDTRTVLFNASGDIANRCLPGLFLEEGVPGSVYKINMVLSRLPTLKDTRVTSRDAFAGTIHIRESYEQMRLTSKNAALDQPTGALPGEIYCHSLTDPSIIAGDLQEKGYHTLTLFGLDVPYHWFVHDNAGAKEKVTAGYLEAINQFTAENFQDCLAVDAGGQPCIQAKSPLDLEQTLGLPRGNIFHGGLSWPFAENEDQAGSWGVETRVERVYICGSSARRGGAVSGIPGHNAAMKILGRFS